jgi:hypothetical protein
VEIKRHQYRKIRAEQAESALRQAQAEVSDMARIAGDMNQRWAKATDELTEARELLRRARPYVPNVFKEQIDSALSPPLR